VVISQTSDESDRLSAALEYAAREMPVFPVGPNKRPLTEHGHLDATCDEGKISEWWLRYPEALIAIRTGAPSRIVALDIDVRTAVHGFDSLEALGVLHHPTSPTAHTPQGGCHVLFRHPGQYVRTVVGRLGPGLDIRGDGGSLILPPGPGRFWDPHLGLNTPLVPMAGWMFIHDPQKQPVSMPAARRVCRLSPYAEAALDNAVKWIVEAPSGQPEVTLNREAYGIGRLASGGHLPPGLALEALRWATGNLQSHDQRWPWRANELDHKLLRAFTDGLKRPKESPSE
jgi:Bifunctional DNA primase/polymerase, N-terminal